MCRRRLPSVLPAPRGSTGDVAARTRVATVVFAHAADQTEGLLDKPCRKGNVLRDVALAGSTRVIVSSFVRCRCSRTALCRDRIPRAHRQVDNLRSVAQRADTAMPEKSIGILFDAAWPSLRDSWTPPSADDTAQEPRRDDADMLSELVNRMRRMEQKIDHNSRSSGPLRESTTTGKKRGWFDELIDLLGDYGVVIKQAGRTNDGGIRVIVDDDMSIVPMAALRALSVVAEQHNRTYVFSGPALPGVTVAPQGIL